MAETHTLITGAASRSGRSIARRLAASRKLLLCDNDAGELEVTRAGCANPESHLTWVRDFSQLEGLGDELAGLLGSKGITIESFIHAAELFATQLAQDNEPALVDRIFSVNLFLAMEVIRPLAQKRVNKGALRNVTLLSSIASRLGAKGCSTYAASRGALNGFCLSLAVELAPNVRVNTVLTGVLNAGMNTGDSSGAEPVASIQAGYPLGSGRAEDVTDAVEFLCSERARWITGQEIVVDGGRLAGK